MPRTSKFSEAEIRMSAKRYIRLWEVRKMTQHRINYAPETCAYCGGKGWTGVRNHLCPACGGTGWAHALRHEE